MKGIAEFIVTIFSTSSPFYIVTYFLLTMGFTYFYTAFTFKPDETAEQLRKNGGFIPGIRPGGRRGLPPPRRDPDHLRRRAVPGIVAVSPSIVALAVPGPRRRSAWAARAS